MIATTLISIIFVVTLYVLTPFMTKGKLPNRFVTKKQVRIKELKTRNENLRSSLRDTDLEHVTGMLLKGDYEKLRAAYLLRIKSITQEIEQLGGNDGSSDIKKQIESEIAFKRKSPTVVVLADRVIMCAVCSNENITGSNFCSKCGAKLKQ